MARETLAVKRERAIEILNRLDAAMPEAKIELDYTTPLELVVAVALSAQTTDRRVNIRAFQNRRRLRERDDRGDRRVHQDRRPVSQQGEESEEAR
jgi:hypothetical protein